MFISRLTLKPEVGQIQLLKQMGRNKYQLHQLLWHLFEETSARSDESGKQLADFVYRVDYPEKQLLVHIVSHREPQNRDGIWDISSKAYVPEIMSGQVLQFHLRVNPTISLYGREKNQRHDVLMHAKKLLKDELKKVGGREPEVEEIWQVTQDAARQWLTKREEHIGVTIDTDHLIIDNYQQERVATESKENAIRYSTVDLQGILTVTDSERFEKALFNGIGKSKAFGCGLLLVRRV